MLVLTRRVGQKIKVGENIFIEVNAIKHNNIELSIESPTTKAKNIKFNKNTELNIGDSITIKADEASKNTCRIGITAPKNVNIVRTELLENEKKSV